MQPNLAAKAAGRLKPVVSTLRWTMNSSLRYSQHDPLCFLSKCLSEAVMDLAFASDDSDRPESSCEASAFPSPLPKFRRLILLVVTLSTLNAQAKDQFINRAAELEQAFSNAQAGDTLLLRPGNYDFYRLDTATSGTAGAPITVRADVPGTARIRATGSELFSVHHPWWVFEDLIIEGANGSDHAFHITGNASHVAIRRNVIIDFNSHIKINGEPGDKYPDDGIVEDNDIFNRAARITDEPVTAIDLVAGSRWVIKDNYIADFAKDGGDRTSYGVFMKGNSDHGVIERNLVICSRNTVGDTQVALSLGGGGTGTEYCRGRSCETEHRAGIIRNNIVLNCSDVGIYLNKASDSLVVHNTLLMTNGIDVRFRESSANVFNNILTGDVRERDGGTAVARDNLAFGNRFGMWIPTIANRLQQRMSDSDAASPSWVSHERRTRWQGLVADLNTRITRSELGLGRDETLRCFPAMSHGDLAPGVDNCEVVSSSPAMTHEDFWGHRRQEAVTYRGAIDFRTSSSDLTARLMRRPVPQPIGPGSHR